MSRAADLLRKGLSKPHRIPPYLLGKAFPASRWGKYGGIELRDGYIAFKPGSFVWTASTRPEFSAKQYYEVRALRQALAENLSDIPVPASLEIGCGYGRLSPWIAEFATEAHAIEPNEDAVADAKIHYPDITFRTGLAQDLPFEDDTFDLVVSWTVLQHVPPDSIGTACREVSRVTADGGVVVLTECTGDKDGPTIWGRPASAYERFLYMSVETTRPKPVERTFNEENTATQHPEETILVFSN